MGYLVRFSARAERDLGALFFNIRAESSEGARKWYFRLIDAILSLEEMPNRCPYALESRRLRNLLFGRRPHIYRVIYRVTESKRRVDILHIRHGAGRPARMK
jgi:toxin ParE1/3/4